MVASVASVASVIPPSDAVPLMPVVAVVVGALVVVAVVVVAFVSEPLEVSSPVQPRGTPPRERRNARCLYEESMIRLYLVSRISGYPRLSP